jgi:hemerythrin-like metal-binding protein
MKLFRLTKDLQTGMVLIDEQHRQYGRFVNAFLKVCQTQDGVADQALFKAFSFLHAYARDHLQAEQGLMETYDYPERGPHLERHRFFSAWIDQTHTELSRGSATLEQLTKIHYMLLEWFQMHIRAEDKKLTAYLRQTAEARGDGHLLGLIRGLFH